MSGREYRLLLLDLDGTLLTKDERITPRVADAVRSVSALVHTSIATGRERHDVLRFAGELGLSAPQISDNGAMIIEPPDGRCLWSAPLPAGTTVELLDRLDRPGMEFIATDDAETVTSAAEAEGRSLNRVSALDLSERAADELVVEYAAVAVLDAVKVFLPYNGRWAVDFTAVGINKAVAARKLAGLVGVGTDQMIAAGDGYNDVPLLSASSLRIAMGDSPEELKSLADFVAPTAEEDGLAVAIEEFVLPRL